MTGRRLEIRAAREACRAARACARRAPATFSLDAERRVLVAAAPGDSEERIVEAARACPNFALEIWSDGARLA